jgi:hypothetical protein
LSETEKGLSPAQEGRHWSVPKNLTMRMAQANRIRVTTENPQTLLEWQSSCRVRHGTATSITYTITESTVALVGTTSRHQLAWGG